VCGATPFFLACHSDPPASLSRRRSLDAPAHVRATYTYPSIRNFTLGIFFSLVTSSELRNAASRLCAVFLPHRGISSSFPLHPASRDLFSHSLLFSALPFVAILCSFGFASELSFFALSLSLSLSCLVSVSQHRELNPTGVSQRSRRRPQNMLSFLIFLTRFLGSGFIREALTGNLQNNGNQEFRISSISLIIFLSNNFPIYIYDF